MNHDDVDLRELRALVALAQEGTFTDAAIVLRTSQPAVSRAVARLEAALQVRLVERTTRSVVFTPAGAQLAAAAERIVRELDRALDAARGRVGPFRLGYTWAAFGRPTADILRTWRERYPDRPLEVHRRDDRSAGLDHGDTDVAVIRGVIDNPEWRREVLFEEGRMVAVPAGHPLADRARVGIRDVDGTVAITPSVGTTTVALWPPDARPRATTVVDNIDEWLTEIASGGAVGVTPASTAAVHAHPGVVYIPIDDVPSIPVNLVWPRAGEHPWTMAFVAHARERIGAARALPSAREDADRQYD